MAVREQSPTFKVNDLGTIKELISGHLCKTSESKGLNLTVAAGELDKDHFALFRKQVAYDTEAYKVYLKRCHDVEHSRFYKRLQDREREAANQRKARTKKGGCLSRASTHHNANPEPSFFAWKLESPGGGFFGVLSFTTSTSHELAQASDKV
jgi:hypothetical protein